MLFQGCKKLFRVVYLPEEWFLPGKFYSKWKDIYRGLAGCITVREIQKGSQNDNIWRYERFSPQDSRTFLSMVQELRNAKHRQSMLPAYVTFGLKVPTPQITAEKNCSLFPKIRSNYLRDLLFKRRAFNLVCWQKMPPASRGERVKTLRNSIIWRNISSQFLGQMLPNWSESDYTTSNVKQ